MKKNICVITGTRAEYGLLRPVMDRIRDDEDLELQIIATGMHLSPEFGLTYHEIENDGFCLDDKIEMLLSSDTDASVAKSMGLGMIGFSDAFRRLSPDMVIVLGDRYESFAAASVAMIMNIPIAHIHGGELTYGAVDDAMRHSITKMSFLHFASTEEYRHRIIQLGEEPERVFYVGALGVENVKKIPLMKKEEVEESLQFPLSEKTALVTFHPVTKAWISSEEQFRQLLLALEEHRDLRYIFTKANADAEGRRINQMIDDFVSVSGGRHAVFTSLGQRRYLSVMKYCGLVIGNSSSGIIEAPSFHIPTVNIGSRQEGRMQAGSVINCDGQAGSITKAIERAKGSDFRKEILYVENPYEKEGTSSHILWILKRFLKDDRIETAKKFYDIH